MTKRVGIFGVTGRMGRSIQELLPSFPTLTLSSATTKTIEPQAKQFFAHQGVLLTTDPMEAANHCDVLIDFSSINTLPRNLEAACAAKKPLIIGTTGLSQEHFEHLQKAAQTIPLLYAANMSLGVAALNKLVAQAALLFGEDFDIHISEAHHRHKMDAPSGTAKTLGKTIIKARGLESQPEHIEFSSMRGGGIVGDHSVSFLADEEVVTLSHRALSRSAFARGALKAAQWLLTQPSGYYTIDDVF